MGTAYVPCNGTVVKRLEGRRGLAVGDASTGGSLGTLALPPLAHWLVAAVGWRLAYVGCGGGVFAALALAATVMRRDPRSMGLSPDGVEVTPARPDARAGPAWSLGGAMGTSVFWLIAAAFTADVAGRVHPARAPRSLRPRPRLHRRHRRVARQRAGRRRGGRPARDGPRLGPRGPPPGARGGGRRAGRRRPGPLLCAGARRPGAPPPPPRVLLPHHLRAVFREVCCFLSARPGRRPGGDACPSR